MEQIEYMFMEKYDLIINSRSRTQGFNVFFSLRF